MIQKNKLRKYASDFSDSQWAIIKVREYLTTLTNNYTCRFCSSSLETTCKQFFNQVYKLFEFKAKQGRETVVRFSAKSCSCYLGTLPNLQFLYIIKGEPGNFSDFLQSIFTSL